MKHLLMCREYTPAPGGGIGTYVQHISRLLAENGEIVHVIAQAWRDTEAVEKELGGRLVVHRLPLVDWTARFRLRPHPSLSGSLEMALFRSGFYPQPPISRWSRLASPKRCWRPLSGLLPPFRPW